MYRLFFIILTQMVFFVNIHFSFQSHVIRENYCSRLEGYNEDVVVPETKTVVETSKKLCWSYKIFCTKHDFKTITVNKTVTVRKFKTVFDCCPGYQKKGLKELCIPICKRGCLHGICIEPDTCLCDPGWREPFCVEKCQPKRFGKGCKNICTCFHGAECDHKTGACLCTKGFTGYNCELPCPKDTYGQNCKNNCKCKNDAMCDIVDGTCICKPGYEGDYCEKPCEKGRHGQGCKKYCICIPETTESCHHVDGKCICKPGYIGESCEKECDDFTYGKNCSNKCKCVNSEFCDPVSGECYCKPGWIGESCSEKCSVGKYGENCSFECTQCLNNSGYCDHITGICNCPSGRHGILCEEVCPSGYWGPNCSKACSCSGSTDCNPENGACALKAEKEAHIYGYSKYAIALSVIGIIVIIVLCIIIMLWKYDKDNLEYLNYSPYFSINFLKRSKTRSSERITDSSINNPAYECSDVVLETEPNGGGYIHGSYSSGIKYIKHMNNLDVETKQSNIEKTDPVPEEVKNITDEKNSDLKKANVLNDIRLTLKEIKRRSTRGSVRNSKAKTDSEYSSSAEVDEDFQPEELDDFNTMENIYEKPTGSVSENIYDDPALLKNKNLSVKEDI